MDLTRIPLPGDCKYSQSIPAPGSVVEGTDGRYVIGSIVRFDTHSNTWETNYVPKKAVGEDDDGTGSFFEGAASPRQVQQFKEQVRVEAEKSKSNFLPPLHVIVYVLATTVFVGYMAAQNPEVVDFIVRFHMHVFGQIADPPIIKIPESERPIEKQQPDRVAYCDCHERLGISEKFVKNNDNWPRHTRETFISTSSAILSNRLTETEIKLGLVNTGGTVYYLKDMALSMIRDMLVPSNNKNIVCMHHYRHGLTSTYKICVLKRGKESFLTLLNPEIKGYSDKSASESVAEDSLFCRSVAVKIRRNIVHVAYTHLSGTPMHLLLEDKLEAHAFQQAWDEMRGNYLCPRTG